MGIVLATATSGGAGLGIVILAVAALMAFGAGLSLRSIWARQTPSGEPTEGDDRLRNPRVGRLRTPFRLLVSFDFGCLVLISAVLFFLGFAVIFRAL